MSYRKKLIEVSLPLEAINVESAREKSIRHGHPSTLHLWWARRPLAACRAVLWSSLVDDPSEYMPDEESANRERDRLFVILEKLVLWENINNEEVLDAAKLEIARSVARDLNCDVPVGKEAIREFLATKAPPVLDPFAGGGSIPLEAQRLGLRAYASDLNPVAVLINKALIEIPPKFAGLPPVHPPEAGQKQSTFIEKEWKGAEGLAEDVRYYGKWMRDEAEKRIGHLYPKVKITVEMLAEREDLRKQGLKPGDELTVIAWLWARTIPCPNPACGCRMPLVRSFALSTKKGKQAWIEPTFNQSTQPLSIRFKVKTGNCASFDGTVNRNGAHCLACGTPVPLEYIREKGRTGYMSAQMTALVVEGKKGRLYFSPTTEDELIAASTIPQWEPDTELPEKALGFRVQLYGMTKHKDLFSKRQLVALSVFSELISEIRLNIIDRVRHINLKEDIKYADAIVTYLAMAIDRLAMTGNNIVRWNPVGEKAQHAFGRQALPMVWDYAEPNFFADATGSVNAAVELVADPLSLLGLGIGDVSQNDVIHLTYRENKHWIIATDPPYYDNIGYGDLSDFFYVWLRHSLGKVYPDLFSTMLVPKTPELVATPFRFGGDKHKAEEFFENGLRKAFEGFYLLSTPNVPVTIFYAFKQSESDGDQSEDEEESLNINITSTGWETMLTGLLSSGFQLSGTWPMHTEMKTRQVAMGTNALASSIVLVCRPRFDDVASINRREFFSELKRKLPNALHQLQYGNVAPVDFAQAAIGPGMAIFSRYKTVLEADGTPMRVRVALALINQALDEYLAEQEGEYDGDTRWALAWFEQYGHEQGPYGVAETLSNAKNTSVEGLSHAGFLEARSGKVHLLRRDELNPDWDPTKDKRLTAWEAAQYLIRALDKEGEKGAGALLGKLGAVGEIARDLAYRLYTICERKGWAQEALAYNMLVVAWPRIKEQAGKSARQETLL